MMMGYVLMGECVHESDEESIQEVGQRLSKCKDIQSNIL